MKFQHRVGSYLFVAFLAVSAAAAAPSRASAQVIDPVEAVPKGTIGLGLVGAEIGFVVPAITGLHETWAFIVFPVLGAGGGATAGYFLIDDPNRAEWSVAALAFGMAMIVPTVVVTLSATAYDPDDEAERNPPTSPVQSQASLRKKELPIRPGGLVQWNGMQGGHVSVGLPDISIRPTYTRDELLRYGGTQTSEFHLSLLRGAF